MATQTLYVDTMPHGKNTVINPNDLDKPNILERNVFDEAIITNANVNQLNSKALFNVYRALKRETECVITMKKKEDLQKVAELGKIAGFIAADIDGLKVTLSKS